MESRPVGGATGAVRAMYTMLSVGTWRVAGVSDAPAAAHSALPPTMIAIILFLGMRDRANGEPSLLRGHFRAPSASVHP